jgi:hypothetical protein
LLFEKKRGDGIALDFWHYLRGEPNPMLLASIPGAKISTVQITDGEAQLKPDRAMLDDCMFQRLLPEKGGLPVMELLRQLSPEFDTLSADELGARCRTSLVRAFELAGLAPRFGNAKEALVLAAVLVNSALRNRLFSQMRLT